MYKDDETDLDKINVIPFFKKIFSLTISHIKKIKKRIIIRKSLYFLIAFLYLQS